MLAFCSCTSFLHLSSCTLVLAPTCASQRSKFHRRPAEQNLLIVTVMSFDRAGNIKHNHHVQTRSVQTRYIQTRIHPDSGRFPAHLSQTLPGQAFLCSVCAKREGSLEFVICSRLAGGLPWRPILRAPAL